jgi:peptidoglycan/LPS O-acetylase OafA/YrhL
MNFETTNLPERNLDLLRAVAVLSVLASHVVFAAGLRSWFRWSGELGWIGVACFFVHTSLVLMGSLERHDSAHWVRDFYLRRAFRIYPLAIAAICFVLAIRLPNTIPRIHETMRAFVAPSVGTLVSNLALVQNFTGRNDLLSPLWTLPIEVQMYLTLPACFLFARGSGKPLVGLFVVSLVVAQVQLSDSGLVPVLWRLNTLALVPCFLSGVITYALLRRAPTPKLPSRLWPLVLGACVVAGCLLPPAGDRVNWPVWIFCLVLGLVIPFVSNIGPGRLATASATIAKYSYGIYLLHVPALWIGLVAFRWLSPAGQWTMFAVALVATTVLAYHLIEKPGIALGVRLVQPRRAAPEVAPGV